MLFVVLLRRVREVGRVSTSLKASGVSAERQGKARKRMRAREKKKKKKKEEKRGVWLGFLNLLIVSFARCVLKNLSFSFFRTYARTHSARVYFKWPSSSLFLLRLFSFSLLHTHTHMRVCSK